MAETVLIELNHDALDALLKSTEVQADLERRALAIAAAAGDPGDYEVRVTVGPTRARASVGTASTAAAEANAKGDYPLVRALDAGRA